MEIRSEQIKDGSVQNVDLAGNISADKLLISYKPPVASVSLLPTSGNSAGDIRLTMDSNTLYSWNGSAWNKTTTATTDYNVGYSIANSQAEDGITTGWSTYLDSAVSAPVDGTGGSPTAHSLSVTATNPLVGTYSFLLSKSAVNGLGEGASTVVAIDRANRGKTSQLIFSYETDTGYIDGAYSVYLYDIAGGAFVPLSVSSLSSTYAKPSQFMATFIANLNSSQYRVILHCTSTLAVSWNIKFDNVQISNQNLMQGAAIGNWNTYTPTITGLGSGGTLANTAQWRRVGSSVEVIGTFMKDSTNGSGSTAVSVSLPQSLSSQTIVATMQIGMADWRNAGGTNQNIPCAVEINSVGDGFVVFRKSNAIATLLNGSDFGATTELDYSFSVPISTWTSNVNLASDFTEYASSTRTTDTNDTDTSTTYNGSDGSFFPSVNLTGSRQRYCKFSRPILPTDLLVLEIKPNGSTIWMPTSGAYGANWSYQTQAGFSYGLGIYGYLDANTVKVNFGTYSNPDGSTFASAGTGWATYSTYKWRVRKVSNGNMAEVPALVRAEYSSPDAAAANTPINFSTKVEDTHSAVTTGTGVWKFTAPISGIYSISFFIPVSGGNQIIRKNGTAFRYVTSSIAGMAFVSGTTQVRLNSGDYIDLTSGSACSVNSLCWISITWLGK